VAGISNRSAQWRIRPARRGRTLTFSDPDTSFSDLTSALLKARSDGYTSVRAKDCHADRHSVGDEGIPLREITQRISDHLGIPTARISAARPQAPFGFLAMVIALDNPTSNIAIRRILG
jgi:hypothetical protein